MKQKELTMEQEVQLRSQLVKMMKGGQAFTPLNRILEGISFDHAGKQAAGLPYTLWQLMEHLRIALWDILEFSRNPDHESPQWPEGYWPEEKGPSDQQALDASRQAILGHLKDMIKLVEDDSIDLFIPFSHGNGQNLMREAMLVAEHNAYHLGQIVVLRRLLDDWE